jgi:molybdopterin-dependent oxidoreductase alpha subunit
LEVPLTPPDSDSRRKPRRKTSAFGGFAPRHWAGLSPYGLGQQKPDPFGEMFKTAWQNRRALPHAWRILTQGVCDGCALGTSGLSDWTMPGVHLCTVRLNLLHLNTMGALDPAVLGDVTPLRNRPGKELRALGRLPCPMVRRRGEKGFTRLSWDEAERIAAERLKGVLADDPDRFACYVTSRGITNEVYYALQKTVRFLGTNNVDNSARLCHAPSTRVLKSMLGATGSTCSYVDWIESDLIVLIGADVANNQPVTTKYLYYAKQRGARIALVNPLKEPGLTRYWIPSVAESALFGTKLADAHFALDQGGDGAFFVGVLKALIERNGVDRPWVDAHTEDWSAVEAQAASASWESLAAQSGASHAAMEEFAAMVAGAGRVVFVWSMGVTQHTTGSSNVRAIVNLALARGMVGRDGAGLMPIRGHSGVQGGSEVGCVPNGLPGARPLDEAGRVAMAGLWGFAPPAAPGLDARAMIDAAHEGRIDAFHVVGGNFLETLPDPAYVEAALARVPLRIHQDIVLTNQMLVEPADIVLLFPARTRYEQAGGGTETTTERRIVFSPEIRGPGVGEARNEWEPLAAIARRARPGEAHLLPELDSAGLRAEIARAVPFYAGIERLGKQGDQVQYGGRHLGAGGTFDRPGGRARFETVALAPRTRTAGTLSLTTRRGKQFNSMVHQAKDPLTGALRRDLLVAREDLDARGLADGDPVVLTSAAGRFEGRARVAPIAAGNVQGFWPEVNVLLSQGLHDAESGVPDYGTVVTLERAPAHNGPEESCPKTA